MSCTTLNFGASSSLYHGISRPFTFRHACIFQKSSAFFIDHLNLRLTNHSLVPDTRHFSGSQAFHSVFKCAVGEPSVSAGAGTNSESREHCSNFIISLPLFMYYVIFIFSSL